MSTSLEFGLDLSAAAAGRRHTAYAAEEVPPDQLERDRIEYLTFLMHEIVPMRLVPNLERLKFDWHPSGGFMRASLGDTPDGEGNCRFHVWPNGVRHYEARGLGRMENGEWDGAIHNHRWWVTSEAIGGYSDRFVNVRDEGTEFTPEEVIANGLFWRYRPWYNADGTEALINTGHCVSTSPGEYRDVKSAEIHTIEPGVYHIPLIPDDKFAATLVVNSNRIFEPNFPYWEDRLEEKEEKLDDNEMWGLPDILIRGATEPIIGARRIATLGEKVLAKVQLLETLSKPPYDFEQALRGSLVAARKQLADMVLPK